MVTIAQSPGATPNYILPIQPVSTFSAGNFSSYLWRPLYWTGDGQSIGINWQLSMANPPVYSDNSQVVTVTLKNYKWSDGTPITSRDVQFFFNLVNVNKDLWGAYIPGDIPDNVVKFTVVNQKTFTLRLRHPVSEGWFTGNDLSLLYALPQHAWDRTSLKGPAGNYDLSRAGATAVFKFLDTESKDTSTWSTDPLWKVVSGPWTLASYDATGEAVLDRNPDYSGPSYPNIKSVELLPFTSDTAEFNELLTGGIDYGYVPFSDLSSAGRLRASGFQIADWYEWFFNYVDLDFNNPTAGPIFRQLYIRQAMQSMVNQPEIISKIYQGHAIADFNPIPSYPTNKYASVTANPNPYSPSRAASLLAAHGWAVHPGGLTRCTRPGTGPTDCGAGIGLNAPLSFNLMAASGVLQLDEEVQALKSTFSQVAGIDLNIALQPSGQVISTAYTVCQQPSASNPSCAWQMTLWGWGSPAQVYPTGDISFSPSAYGGGADSGHYDDPEVNALINESLVGNLAALHAYDQYITNQVPMIFLPQSPKQISAIKTSLVGAAPQNVVTTTPTPEMWK